VQLLGADRLGDALDRLLEAAAPLRTHVGWATIELDRAGRELGAAIVGARSAPDLDEPLLGARSRLTGEVLLLEPSSEGLLAAGLARHGEGPLALYVVVQPGAAERVRAAGFLLSPSAPGPLGTERRVLVGPRDGPFLLLVTP
jgi:hypothetical protein